MIICNIGNIIPKDNFVKSVDSYRTLVKYLEGQNIGFHRSYRVVIKELHHSTSIEDIKAELIRLLRQVHNVSNMRSKLTKESLPMIYITN